MNHFCMYDGGRGLRGVAGEEEKEVAHGDSGLRALTVLKIDVGVHVVSHHLSGAVTVMYLNTPLFRMSSHFQRLSSPRLLLLPVLL